jgi:HAD superfamily hydrolase (TIGR01458 family)
MGDSMIARSFLIDIDGVLYIGKSPIHGVRECLERLDELEVPYRFISNSTRRCRSSVATRLRDLGYSVAEEKIFTPPIAAVEKIRRSGKDRCFLLATGDVHKDFEAAGIIPTEEDVDYVVVADAGENFTFDMLNKALRLILDGARIFAMEKDRYWMGPDGLVLSTGAFVAALEYASGKEAELVGKPSRNFFEMVLKDLGAKPSDSAMIGDDIFTDVGGAKAMGMKGILVKTGKYREDLVRSSGGAA